MSALTPVYGWPYQSLPDPPDGAALGQNLGIAIEQTVRGIDTRLVAAEASAASSAAVLPYRDRQTLVGTSPLITFTGIPANLRSLKLSWRARSDIVANSAAVQLRVNNDAGANYDNEFTQSAAATAPTSVNTNNQTSLAIGFAPGTTTATAWGSGILDFTSWDDLTGSYLQLLWRYMGLNITGAGSIAQHGGGAYHAAGPYIRLDIFPVSNNFIAGSDFQIYGERA